MSQAKKQTKLSKQQKMILKIIFKNQKKNREFKYDNRNISERVYAEQYTFPPMRGDLTPSYSASVSRSAKRLEERGLIGRNRSVSMFLTDKGMKFCRSLFGDKLDKHEIGKIKRKSVAEIVAPKVKVSPEAIRKAEKIKRIAKRDKTTAEDWEDAKKGKISINSLYKQVIRREAIRELEKESSVFGKDLKDKKPAFTLKEVKRRLKDNREKHKNG